MDQLFRNDKSRIQNNRLTVYCYSGTYGLEYARKHGYTVLDANKYINDFKEV